MELFVHDLRKDIYYSIEFLTPDDMNQFLSFFNPVQLCIIEVISKNSEELEIFKEVIKGYIDMENKLYG